MQFCEVHVLLSVSPLSLSRGLAVLLSNAEVPNRQKKRLKETENTARQGHYYYYYSYYWDMQAGLASDAGEPAENVSESLWQTLSCVEMSTRIRQGQVTWSFASGRLKNKHL